MPCTTKIFKSGFEDIYLISKCGLQNKNKEIRFLNLILRIVSFVFFFIVFNLVLSKLGPPNFAVQKSGPN